MYNVGAFDAEYNSYVVYGPEGGVLVDQNNAAQIPQNAYNIVVCEKEEEPEIVSNSFDTTVVVFPNPANSMLSIKTSLDVLSIEVFNTIGSRILESQNQGKKLDVSSLSEGTYVVKVRTIQGVEFRKISIMH